MADTPLRILLLASEVSPFARTGEIADVVGELARALKRLGHDVRLAMPRDRTVRTNGSPRVIEELTVQLSGINETVSIIQGKLDPDVPVYFVENKRLFDREKLYMFDDDADRFLYFSRVALDMLPLLDWKPDVIHVNDWQTAIIPNWLKTIYASVPFYQGIASTYTIHNLEQFGTFGQRVLELAGLEPYGYIEHPNVSNQINRELNFMARGILFADAINTVSPKYAREIQTPEYGEGLDPILAAQSKRLRGIVNGIDYTRENPATDPELASPFDADHLDERSANKRALQSRADLEPSAVPLVTMFLTTDDDRGIDLALEVIEPILSDGAQWVVMGQSESRYTFAFQELERKHPEHFCFFNNSDEFLRRQLLAGSDLLLMPLQVEPGETTQLLAMHYGCVPVVYAGSGLEDSVASFDAETQTGTGFVFDRANSYGLYAVLIRAFETYACRGEWQALQERGMRADVSWEHTAQAYAEMYSQVHREKAKVIAQEAEQAREIELTKLVMDSLPGRIRGLADLVYNLWWSWNPDATHLLERIDPLLWEATGHNPIKLLRRVAPERLEHLTWTEDFLSHYERVMRMFQEYIHKHDTWFRMTYPNAADKTIAYFSAEFGIHESLPIYSGGLGILSGDHIKELSDMGVPLVGIGFLYPQGYFRQEIDAQGKQIDHYDKLSFALVPAHAAKDKDGNDVLVNVELPGRAVYAKVYEIKVGRISLYLMDTDIERNAPQDRDLSARLYGGNYELRIMQEIVLGIGGVRVLRKLGLNPSAFHMNEGHSAFLVLELTRELVAQGKTFEEAMKEVAEHSLFTTHTPVPAGNDAFGLDLMDKYFSTFYPQLGLDREKFLELADDSGLFGMTVLGLRFSAQRNGVSKIHGEVSRKMWAKVLPSDLYETPIGHVTNGVHTATWLAPERYYLFNEVLGADWYDNLDDSKIWEPLRHASNARLWEIQQTRKKALVEFSRDVVSRQLTRQNADRAALEGAQHILDPNALTIGFARRFATYKRATLILRDLERLKRIVNHSERPVQFIFAGKAHPADVPGQSFIRAVYRAMLDPELNGKLILLEDYGMDDARMLVAGVDVWLNNPRPPLEASGTSGEKAALNGVLNFSVLDGWWAEGYNGKNGWAIGDVEFKYPTEDAQDAADALAIYQGLENEIVPLYFERGDDGIPHKWLELSKESIITLAPIYSTRRMLKEYCQFYLRALEAGEVGEKLRQETMG